MTTVPWDRTLEVSSGSYLYRIENHSFHLLGTPCSERWPGCRLCLSLRDSKDSSPEGAQIFHPWLLRAPSPNEPEPTTEILRRFKKRDRKQPGAALHAPAPPARLNPIRVPHPTPISAVTCCLLSSLPPSLVLDNLINDHTCFLLSQGSSQQPASQSGLAQGMRPFAIPFPATQNLRGGPWHLTSSCVSNPRASNPTSTH